MTTYTKIIIAAILVLLIGNIAYLYSQYKATVQIAVSDGALESNPLFLAHKDSVVTNIQKKSVSIPASSFELGPTEKAAAVFEPFYANMKTEGTFRIKIFDTKSTIIWSNLPEVIGQRFPDDDELKEVLEDGDIIMETKLAKQEQITERNFANFSEAIVPISNNGKIVGAIETYQSIEDISSALQDEFMATLVKTLGISLVLLILVAVGGKFLIR